MSVTKCLTFTQDNKRDESLRRQQCLPPIAPKGDQVSSTGFSRSDQVNAPSIPPKVRLPPRSRDGCWTCRTRKVKCDQWRPVCGQCYRLRRTCDYKPPLSFRDNTSRVVKRMQDVTTIGSFVWDRVVSPTPSNTGSTIDDRAPFATLLTDEDRERKAESSLPGTFNVIVNQGSFQHLTEYASDGNGQKKNERSPLHCSSFAVSLASSLKRESVVQPIALPSDPNTVILPRFEDISRRSTRKVGPPVSQVPSIPLTIKREESDGRTPSRTPETTVLRHFRDVVWKQLTPPEHEPDSSIVLLDTAAIQFPPLVRAMMAVGSLAMFKQDGKERLDSLQHYSAILPKLRNTLHSEEDLASDGAFLTHFLMLIYEITTASNEHPDIWRHQISTLLKITLLRQRIFGRERFPFIVWWICTIDLGALLTSIGTGEYVEHMLKNDLIPPPSCHLYPLGVDGSSIVYPEEREALPTVLQLDYEVTLCAVRLGLLAAEFRADREFEAADMASKDMAVKMRQSRISDIRDGLDHSWTDLAVQGLCQMQLPIRARRLFQHAWTLYRACIIYSHTSMWPSQRVDTCSNFDAEINLAAKQITEASHAIINTEPNGAPFLIFPLFMAGFGSTVSNEKMLIRELIQQIEQGDFGQNTRATRITLEAVYEQQKGRFMQTGQSLDVDWFRVMLERGLRVVSFGL